MFDPKKNPILSLRSYYTKFSNVIEIIYKFIDIPDSGNKIKGQRVMLTA